MRYLGTRGGESVGLVDAVMRGLAADGGLYVPEELPRFSAADFKGESLADIAADLLTPFFFAAATRSAIGASKSGRRFMNSSTDAFARASGTSVSTSMSPSSSERPASRARITALRATSTPERSSRGSGSV